MVLTLSFLMVLLLWLSCLLILVYHFNIICFFWILPQTIFSLGFSRPLKWTKYAENNIKQGVDFFKDCLLNILPQLLVPFMHFSIFKDLDCENHSSPFLNEGFNSWSELLSFRHLFTPFLLEISPQLFGCTVVCFLHLLYYYY